MATFKAPTVKSTGTPKYSPPKLPKPVPMGLGGRLHFPGTSAPGPAVPAAAAAPPPPAAGAQDSVLPPDATYEQILGALQRKRDTTLSQLAGQRTTTLLDYGFNEGAGGVLSYDPNNPESKAAQLKKHYDQSRSGTGITMANAGQLYAGSYQNAQDNLNRSQLTDEDRLSKALTSYLANNTAGRAGARTDYEIGAGQAYGDRVARVPQNPLYSPTADQAPEASATLSGFGGQSIPDGTYSAKSAPAGLTAQGVKIAPGYVVVVRGGKVVDLRKQR